MPNTKPLVNVATTCEKILVEKDGVASAIRVVDTYFIPELAAIPADVVHRLQMSALVALKSGDFVGQAEISLVLRTPEGKSVPIPERWPVVFNGGEHGVNLAINFALPAKDLGLFWVDVVCDGETLTSFPVKLARAPTGTAEVPKS